MVKKNQRYWFRLLVHYARTRNIVGLLSALLFALAVVHPIAKSMIGALGLGSLAHPLFVLVGVSLIFIASFTYFGGNIEVKLESGIVPKVRFDWPRQSSLKNKRAKHYIQTAVLAVVAISASIVFLYEDASNWWERNFRSDISIAVIFKESGEDTGASTGIAQGLEGEFKKFFLKADEVRIIVPDKNIIGGSFDSASLNNLWETDAVEYVFFGYVNKIKISDSISQDFIINLEVYNTKEKNVEFTDTVSFTQSTFLTARDNLVARIMGRLRDGSGVRFDESLYESNIGLYGTDNNIAASLYINAKGKFSNRGRANLETAISALKEAVRLDPKFAEAWGALAQVYSLSFYWKAESIENAIKFGKEAADIALSLDDKLVDAKVAKANLLREEKKWQSAEKYYLEVLKTDPRHVEALSQYSQLLARVGKFKIAEEYTKRAFDEKPDGPIYVTMHGMVLYTLGHQLDDEVRKNEGIKLLSTAVSMMRANGDFAIISRMGAFFSDSSIRLDPRAEGDLRELIIAAEKRSTDVPPQLLSTELLNYLNDKDKALVYLGNRLAYWNSVEEPIIQGGVVVAAMVSSSFGNHQLGLGYLKLLARDNVVYPPWLWMPAFDEIRKLDEFVILMDKLELTTYWKANGYSDWCSENEGEIRCL